MLSFFLFLIIFISCLSLISLFPVYSFHLNYFPFYLVHLLFFSISHFLYFLAHFSFLIVFFLLFFSSVSLFLVFLLQTRLSFSFFKTSTYFLISNIVNRSSIPLRLNHLTATNPSVPLNASTLLTSGYDAFSPLSLYDSSLSGRVIRGACLLAGEKEALEPICGCMGKSVYTRVELLGGTIERRQCRMQYKVIR